MSVKYIDIEKVHGSVDTNQRFEQLFGLTPFPYFSTYRSKIALRSVIVKTTELESFFYNNFDLECPIPQEELA